ncbi:MAG TPA: hypothetical protein VMJ14_13585 [Burkholderiales bacterium]|nr:hypothetical protein [Burkholderiales bacterium]
MAYHHDAQAPVVLDEQLAPARLAHQLGDIAATDRDRAAFVEYRQHVAQPATLAAFFRDLRRVYGVDACLGFRESEPGERVEQVVLALGPCLHLAGFEQVDFVIGVGRSGRYEPDRFSVFSSEILLFRKRIQKRQRRRTPDPFQPLPDRIEDRVS